MLDALIIAAHPDDAELGMGGTILRMLEDGLSVGILDLTIADIDTEFMAAFVDLGVEIGNGGLGFESRIFTENSGDDLEGRAELLDRILIETWLLLGILLNLICEVHLGGTSAREKTRVSDQRFHGVNTIINGALNIIKLGMCAATEDNSGHLVLFQVSAEDSAPCA